MTAEDNKELKIAFEALKLQVASLQTEFKILRNIMVTLYLTIVAPLLVIIFANFGEL